MAMEVHSILEKGNRCRFLLSASARFFVAANRDEHMLAPHITATKFNELIVSPLFTFIAQARMHAMFVTGRSTMGPVSVSVGRL